MLKRYTVKNPYNEFEVGEYYSESEIDNIYDDISDTITETILNNAIADFIPGDEVYVRASGYTTDFEIESYIDGRVVDYTDEWIENTEINTRISNATRNFLDDEELTDKMNTFLVNYVTNTNVTLLIDSSVTYLQEYWHPSPVYERYVEEPPISYIASDDRSYVDFVLSANTSWSITNDFPSPFGWVSLNTWTAFGTTVIRATVNSENTTGSNRSHTYIGTAPDVYNTSPFEITITQNYAGSAH